MHLPFAFALPSPAGLREPSCSYSILRRQLQLPLQTADLYFPTDFMFLMSLYTYFYSVCPLTTYDSYSYFKDFCPLIFILCLSDLYTTDTVLASPECDSPLTFARAFYAFVCFLLPIGVLSSQREEPPSACPVERVQW